jgi:HlyD family secretion protein
MPLSDAPSRLRQRLPWILAAIVVLGALLAWRFAGRGEPAPQFQTAAVDRGDVASRVSASGSLSAVVTVEVGSQVSGRIQSLFADYNSVVTKGQRIAKIDPALFEAAAAQSAANVQASEGNLARLQVQAEDAARQARRSSQLFEGKLISENDRDNAVANARAAAASEQQAEGLLAQARAALRQAQTNLRYTDILAPTDGIVISRAVNVGQTVAASFSAPIIFTIAQDLRAMEVHTSVAESDIGRLRAGMNASFTVDAYPGEPFEGRIREIRNAAQVVQNVVTYDAVIDVANPDLKLKPGMTATVTVIADRRDAVLRVPNAALRFRPEAAAGGAPPAMGGAPSMAARGAPGPAGAAPGPRGAGGAGGAAGSRNARTVYVLVGGAPVPRQVKSGLSDGSFTEITDGELREGEAVIVGFAPGTPGAAAQGGGRGPRGGFRIL